ncbi:adenylate kinase family protein [uncultured Methanobrevibacter sp.]|uniref:adenylate kinase family protein n=1 Tax=uncultured Methanobrevibacter sp. TaxID=253161 RepID=UPI00260ADA1E|nr:adenylate kinase family protein [uncultured Methanobrevibacter sp.]
MNQVIFISGTPCVGKTTVANELSQRLGANLIRVNELAINKDLVLGIDDKKGYKIIDVDKLNGVLGEIIDKLDSDNLLIVEGHLSHLCLGADKVIILRVHPDILKERLSSRNYSESKIRENLEAEALDVCGAEAYDTYLDDVIEINAGDLTIDEIINQIVDVIFDKKEHAFDEINFMDWLVGI